MKLSIHLGDHVTLCICRVSSLVQAIVYGCVVKNTQNALGIAETEQRRQRSLLDEEVQKLSADKVRVCVCVCVSVCLRMCMCVWRVSLHLHLRAGDVYEHYCINDASTHLQPYFFMPGRTVREIFYACAATHRQVQARKGRT